MKLGYLTPLSVETIANARALSFDSVEAGMGWGARTHFPEAEAGLPALRDALARQGIAVTSVAVYGGAVEAPADEAIAYYERAIKFARALDCSVVSGLTGRDNTKTVDENLPLFKERFEPIARIAANYGVRLAMEPWPGSVLGHGPYRWTNLATTPELWDKLFDAVPDEAFGLEYDPSHLAWQEIDYVQAIRDYGTRIYHMHAKDITYDRALLKRVGVHGSGWWRFVIPGLGELDWSAIFGALSEVGYAGDIAVEHEDNVYLGERWNEGLTIGHKFLRPLVTAYSPRV
ncbi:MAG: sugar phosphate isomerase/epimerase family protein [Anaerolineae bacterium]